MGEMTQINLRVDSSTKEKWERFLEETGAYKTISELIRNAVQAEIKDDDTRNSGTESPALASDIQDISEDLERVRKDVRWLRDQKQDSVDISDVAQDVYDELVELPEPQSSIEVPDESEMGHQEYRRFRGAQMIITPSDTEEAEQEGSTKQTRKAIADRLGYSTDEVQDALEYLQDQFMPVVDVEVDGQTHYFKEE